MECQLKLSYKQKKLFNKMKGKLTAREIAMGRNLIKMIRKNYSSPVVLIEQTASLSQELDHLDVE